jgi:hypothetical protein
VFFTRIAYTVQLFFHYLQQMQSPRSEEYVTTSSAAVPSGSGNSFGSPSGEGKVRKSN